jgi:AcrR family transcriptional regulator
VTTRERILDTALVHFGGRGYQATSLDALAADLGVTKQAILYWFGSKEGLLDAVVQRGAEDLGAALEAAIASAPSGLRRLDAVIITVFRFAVRRPALLGLMREVNRLGPDVAKSLATQMRPLIDRAMVAVQAEMDRGTVRSGDPRFVLLFVYTMLVGVATEVEVQRALGIEPSTASLRRLRRELFVFVRAALRP